MGSEHEIEDLQAVSAHILAAAQEILLLEEEKRHTDPTSERFRVLSLSIEESAADINAVSHAESALAEEVATAPRMPTVAEADAATPHVE
jgi:hypothetical protein